MRQRIFKIIDFFYPPFKKFLPVQTFRYAVCGGSNMLLDIFLFYISYNFIIQKKVVTLGFFSMEPYNAALLMSFCITFPLGFLLSKFIVFNGSHLRTYVQLVRYVLIVAINLFLNYALLNILVEYLHFYPTIAKIFINVIISIN